MTATCPWCNAPRSDGTSCPKCGADYAKAEAIRKHGRASAATTAPAQPPTTTAAQPLRREEGSATLLSVMVEPEAVDDRELELKFCIAAIPAMLLVAILFNLFAHFLQRTFLTMPVHELGHAVASWLTGYWAIPTLWKTLTAESRGFLMPLVILGGAGWLFYKGWADDKRALVALAAAIALLQIAGTFVISENTSQMLIVFGGDAGGMILATLLMISFFFGKQTQLYKGSLRWGFVAIGAAAFVDMFGVWISSKRDRSNIPFGEIDGVGHSDATRLVDDFGWSDDALINRHLAVGVVCLLVLAAVYAWGVRRAWLAARAE
jgi:hypothetical protein